MMIMAVLRSPASSGDSFHDETQQYFFILCSKVMLNTLVLFFWMSSIHKSLLGLCSIFMHLTDVILLIALSYVWLYRESTAASMCFILAHSSTIYNVLPLPILIIAVLDYITYPNLVTRQRSQRRFIVYCITVALLWAWACTCSYLYTDAHPVQINKYKDVKVLACRVRGSTVVSHFCTDLFIMVSIILLLHLKKLTGWIRRANKMSEQRDCRALVLEKAQDFPYSQTLECGDCPSLFVSLTLGFAVIWMPYLFICVACDMVGLVVPSYVSINLMWMACVNSALAGMALWCKGDRAGPFPNFPDDICLWKIYWQLNKSSESVNTVHLSARTNIKTLLFHNI